MHATKVGAEGETLHDPSSLVNHFATLIRYTVVFARKVRIEKLALPTALQRRAFDLFDRTRPASPRLQSWVKGLSVAGWRSHPDGCLTPLR